MFSAHSHNQVSFVVKIHLEGSIKMPEIRKSDLSSSKGSPCIVCLCMVVPSVLVAPPINWITCSVFLMHVYHIITFLC